MAAHYMNGGYFPVGGSQRISECLIPTIQRAGGRVFVKASVESIVVDENGKASGVMMENGDQVLEWRCADDYANCDVLYR